MPRQPKKPHLCHAVGCTIEVPPRLLMHHEHWMMVSKATRDWVQREYVKGQEKTKTPTLEYMVAMDAAISEVARKEGKTLAADAYKAKSERATCLLKHRLLKPGEPDIPGVTKPRKAGA